MGKTNKKYGSISVESKPIWKIGKGHNGHVGGSGTHDNRPKRLRTRGNANRRAIGDYS
jgi:hypothetical protein